MDRFIPDICVSHRDADGMIAGILIEKVFNVPVISTSYDNLSKSIKAAMEQGRRLILTDISPTQEHIQMMSSVDFRVLDHHATTRPLLDSQQDRIVWDDAFAGSTLTFHWLARNFPEKKNIIEPYREIAEVTEDYDLWRHEDPRSIPWTAMIDMMGFDWVRSRLMNNPSANFTENELKLVDVIQRKREVTLNFLLEECPVFTSNDGSNRLLFVNVENRHLTCLFEELSAVLREHEIDFGIVIFPTGRVSLRSRGRINLLETFWCEDDMFRGHPYAVGLNPKFTVEDVINRILMNYEHQGAPIACD